MIITGTCDEAVKAGKIREHRLADIELTVNGTKHDRTDFVFPPTARFSSSRNGFASARAIAMLDEEYAEWSKPAKK